MNPGLQSEQDCQGQSAGHLVPFLVEHILEGEAERTGSSVSRAVPGFEQEVL